MVALLLLQDILLIKIGYKLSFFFTSNLYFFSDWDRCYLFLLMVVELSGEVMFMVLVLLVVSEAVVVLT